MLEKERNMEIVAEETHDSISVELVRKTSPDILIIYDIIHRLNGEWVINQIVSELPKVKVIVIGVDSDQESIKAMLGHGVSGYLLEDCSENESPYLRQSRRLENVNRSTRFNNMSHLKVATI